MTATKICIKCLQEKTLEEFPLKGKVGDQVVSRQAASHSIQIYPFYTHLPYGDTLSNCRVFVTFVPCFDNWG